MMGFPFDLFDACWLPQDEGSMGQRITMLEPLCLKPPWPWGHWLYGRLIEERLDDLRGDFVECGVAKGGTTLFLGDFARRNGRRVFALDSFVGLPEPRLGLDNPYFCARDYDARPERGDLLERLKARIDAAGFNDVIVPIAGFFEQTLSSLPSGPLAFVHIDADLHDSVLVCLEALWPRVVDGGIVVIDDFFHQAQGPARACSRFFQSVGVRPLLHVSFPYSVLVIKGETPPDHLGRSIDGHRYSLDLLRADPILRNAIGESTARAIAAHEQRTATNAVLLRDLLSPCLPSRSGDIYDYWRALEAYWDDMDVETVAARPPLLI